MAKPTFKNVSHNQTLLEALDAERLKFLGPVIGWIVFLMVAGLLGNALVCYVHGKKIQRSTANNFILWLATLDLFTCLVGMPMELLDITRSYTFDNPALCKVMRFVIYLGVMTSVATLVFIAMDRYFKICRPLRVSPIRRCRLVIFLSLCIGLLLAWPSLVIFGRKKLRAPKKYPGIYGVDCSIDDRLIHTVYPTVYFIILGTAFLTGATILILLYVVIGRKLYRRNRCSIGEDLSSYDSKSAMIVRLNSSGVKASAVPQDSLQDSIKKKKRKRDNRYNVSRTSVIFCTISVVFVISFLPSLALMTLRTISTSFAENLSHGQYVVFSLFLRTYFINNCVNPIIYGFLNRQFRKECIKVFTSCLCRESENDTESSNHSATKMIRYVKNGSLTNRAT